MSSSKETSSLGSKEEKMNKNSDTEEEEETVGGSEEQSPSAAYDHHQEVSDIAKSGEKGKAAMSSENQGHDHDRITTVTPHSIPRQHLNGDNELKGKATSAPSNIHDQRLQSDENTSQSN